MNSATEISNLFAWVVFTIISGLILFDCRKDLRQLVSARNVFLLTLIAWYLLEALVVPDELLKYDQTQYNFGLFCVLLSAFSFVIFYTSVKGTLFYGTFRRLSKVDNPNLIWGVFIFSICVGFLPLVVVANGNVWLILEDAFLRNERWGSIFQRGRFGGARDAFLELQMFLRAALPFAAAVIAQKRQTGSRRIFVFFFLTFMIFRALNDGTRSKVLEVLLPVAAAIYWRMSPAVKRRALAFGLPIVTAIAMLWASASVVGRNTGELKWEQAWDTKYVGFEMFRELLFLNRLVPEQADYKYGHTYLVQLVNPIPRFLWPNKPTGDGGLELAIIQTGVNSRGQAHLTIAPGILGEMYWNFGIIGLIGISMVLGWMAKSWDQIRPFASQSLLAFTVFAAGLAVVFVSGRAMSMSAFYGLLSLYFILVLFSKTNTRKMA